MSHDVQLWPRKGPIDLARMTSWLASQPNWAVKNRSALYQNPNTGVYFTLDLNDPTSADDEPPIVAAINVYRPSFFGLECSEILADVVAQFDLLADDDGDDEGIVEYSPQWLVSRWNVANAAGYRAIAPQDASPNPLPKSRLLVAWQWNRNREALQDELKDELFVPKISLIRTASGPATMIVWSDVIPFALPLVAHVVLYRAGTALRKLLRKGSNTELQTRSAVVDALGEFALERDGRIDFLELPAPPAVTQWVTGLAWRGLAVEGIAWDRVHDTELLSAAT